MRQTQLLCIGVATLFLLGGCNKQPPADTAAPTTQPGQASNSSAPASAPGSPATGGSTASQPGSSVLGVPGPRAAAPAPRPVYTIPSGTRLAVSINETISAKNSDVGDRFHGVLSRPVMVNGVAVLGRGTPVSGTVIAAKGQGKFKGSGELGITLTSLGSESITTTDYIASIKGKGKRTAGFIAGGGGGGALIGGLAGGGKGALIGGLIGAGAGTAGAGMTGNKDVVIPAETIVSFTLSSPIRVEGRAPASETR